MRIRTQLTTALAAAAAIGIATLLSAFASARSEYRLTQSLARAQAISHEVSGLLVLTQEYALHADPRAAQQWQHRHAAIAGALEAEAGAYRANASFEQLRSVARALPEVFARWQGIAADGSEFAGRRREVLLDQILTSAQAMSDHAHQWYGDVERDRSGAERVFLGLALLVPLVGAGGLAALGLIVHRRVLEPLKQFEEAARAFGGGDGGVRLNRREADELGELARSFDRMAATVEQRTGELRASENRLRAVADNLPVLIAYLDAHGVYRFTNAHFARMFNRPAEAFLGQTVEQALGAPAWAPLREAFAATLAGERRSLTWPLKERGRAFLLDVELVPDRAADGTVHGLYAMASDVSARHEAEAERARSEHFLRLVADNTPALLAYIDHQERYRFANAEYRHRLGWDPAALAGARLADRMSASAYADVLPHLQAALRGERRRFERLVDGGSAWLLTTFVPDVGDDGAVAGVFALSIDITEQKRHERLLREREQQMAALAREDTLTGLPNRLQYNERQQEALQRAERSGLALALMFLDVDNFKAINDSLGHAAGDAVLREFARRVQDSVRSTDTVARLAGDEFVVILEGLHGEAEPQLVARKILSNICRPMEVDGRLVNLTTSIGIAYLDGACGTVEASQLLAQADRALYEAKGGGRNGYALARVAASTPARP